MCWSDIEAYLKYNYSLINNYSCKVGPYEISFYDSLFTYCSFISVCARSCMFFEHTVLIYRLQNDDYTADLI